MSNRSITVRAWTVSAVLLAGAGFLFAVGQAEPVPIRKPLEVFPYQLGPWRGENIELEERIIEAAGVDDHLSRIYATEEGWLAGLYIGYYGSQRKGDLIHSPKNCLPGAGWEPIRSGRLSLTGLGGTPVTVNEYIIEKGLKRQLVLYWYHSRGRVVASEYMGKVFLVTDAITRNRTDGSLIRVVVPLRGEEEEARARAVEFAQAFFPFLNEFIPD